MVELHWEGSALQAAQQACFLKMYRILLFNISCSEEKVGQTNFVFSFCCFFKDKTEAIS